MRNHSYIPAFTLIELITVVAIVCIVAAMVIPPYRNIGGQSRQSSASEQLAESIVVAATRARNLAIRKHRFVTMYIPCGLNREYEDGEFDDDAAFEARPYEYKLASTRLMFSEKGGDRCQPLKWAQPAWTTPVADAKVALMVDRESDVPVPGDRWPVPKLTSMDDVPADAGTYTFTPSGGIDNHAGAVYIVATSCKFNGSTLVYPATPIGDPTDFVVVKIDCLTGEVTRFVKK